VNKSHDLTVGAKRQSRTIADSADLPPGYLIAWFSAFSKNLNFSIFKNDPTSKIAFPRFYAGFVHTGFQLCHHMWY